MGEERSRRNSMPRTMLSSRASSSAGTGRAPQAPQALDQHLGRLAAGLAQPLLARLHRICAVHVDIDAADRVGAVAALREGAATGGKSRRRATTIVENQRRRHCGGPVFGYVRATLSSTNEPGLKPDAPGHNRPPLTYKDAASISMPATRWSSTSSRWHAAPTGVA